jgi:hypothetical protein
MWEDRLVIPGGFMGENVYVIRFTRYQESYMPFVIIETKANIWDNGKEEFIATVGGLTGRKYEEDKKASISTYSSSGIRGKTLQDVLYSITH